SVQQDLIGRVPLERNDVGEKNAGAFRRDGHETGRGSVLWADNSGAITGFSNPLQSRDSQHGDRGEEKAETADETIRFGDGFLQARQFRYVIILRRALHGNKFVEVLGAIDLVVA